MCDHQRSKSQTRFACRHLIRLCMCGMISIPKFSVYFLTYDISFRMLRLQSEESSEIRSPDIQISALVTEPVIKSHILSFSPENPIQDGKWWGLVISLFSSLYFIMWTPHPSILFTVHYSGPPEQPIFLLVLCNVLSTVLFNCFITIEKTYC